MCSRRMNGAPGAPLCLEGHHNVPSLQTICQHICLSVRKKAEPDKKPVHSVTSLIAYEVCPWQYYTTHVRGIAPPVTRWMRRGTSVHSLIAKHLKGKQPLPQVLDGGVEPEIRPLLDRFLGSRFNVAPHLVEKGFILPFGPGSVRGRIDLVLPRPDGGLEIVDFKSGSGSGRSREEVEGGLQLPLYAMAVSRRFEREPRDVSVTYYFLGDNHEISFTPDEESAGRLTERVEGIMRAVAEGRFDPRDGCECYACQWRQQWRGRRERT